MSHDNEYFALKDADDLAADIMGKVDAWENHLETSGLRQRWAKSYNMYYGRHFNLGNMGSDGIESGGQDNELALIKANHYRNLLQHILIMTTKQKPAFDTQAMNAEPDSLAQARLGNDLLDFYISDKRLGRYVKLATEMSVVMGKGFVECVWDPSKGEAYGVKDVEDENGEPTQKQIAQGDIELSTVDPFSLIVDLAEEDFTKCQWQIVRKFQNRFDLAAIYPQMSETLKGMSSKSDLETNRKSWHGTQNLADTALIPVWYFYHKKTPAVPNGRMMIVAGADCMLYDGAMPFRRLPVFRIVPGEIFGTTEGYTGGFDLISLQEAIDVLLSTAFTNQQAFGVNNILAPEASGVSAEQLTQNLKLIKYKGQTPPSVLQLCATPAEIFTMINLLQSIQETVSGVNAVARGNEEAIGDKSGKALSIIQSMAYEYASGLIQSWAEMNEDLGTHIFELLQDYATTDRVLEISGKSNSSQMSSFNKDSIKNIRRVKVELGNPASRTTAGRLEMADNYLNHGFIKTPEEYDTVVKTGQLETLTRSTTSSLTNIHRENEMLMEGSGQVIALVTDDHPVHMAEHRANCDDPKVRMNPALHEATLAHITEHNNLWKNMDPALCAALKIMPYPFPPMMPGMMPPTPGGMDPAMAPPPEGMPPPPEGDIPMPPQGDPNMQAMPTEMPMEMAQ